MTSLLEVVNRSVPPEPWAEGDNIPWNEPSFSRRMLAYHLDQQHDLASRRIELIDRHVDWIHKEVLGKTPMRILDLTCGPGLYTARLAALGHECVGVDFSPASIAHAKKVADRDGLRCRYVEHDVRRLEPSVVGEGFGLVMMLWGQFNVFRRSEATQLLAFARSVLAEGGRLLLEPQRSDHLKRGACTSASWRTEASGLFSDRPHLVLEEAFWDDGSRTSTHRFFVVDAATAEVTRYAMSNEAYSRQELTELLRDAGYGDVRIQPSLTGAEEESSAFTFAASARLAPRS